MDEINEILTRGVENIYPNREALGKRLKSGEKMRIYAGYDPSAPSLHIGNAITLRKLAQFQKLGHQVIMLIGDFTGMIGDPTDKTAARKKLTRKEVLANAKDYKKQAGKILSFSGKNSAKLFYNSQWSDKLTFADLVELASNFTAQQMMTRDMFQERLKQNKPIYLHEFLYPLAQAYDSVAMDVDMEIGGNDQTFNMLCGRDLMKAVKQKEKFVLTMKLLEDSTGKKMGKTEGNIVNLNENPKEMFGKVMSWSDELIVIASELCTDLSLDEMKVLSEPNTNTNPRDAKAKLAREIVRLYHGEEKAEQAEREFNQVFREKKKPTEMPAVKIKESKMMLTDLIVKTKLVSSKNEAKRLIKQGGVKIDGEVKKDWEEEITIKEMVIQVGKRKFARIMTK